MDRSFPNQDTRSFWGSQNFNAEVFCEIRSTDHSCVRQMKELHVKLMTTLCEFFRIKKIATRPYHPQSNSPVERYNSVISQCLRAYIDKEQNNWPKLLPSVLMSFRRSPCKESTQFRPTECSLENRWIFLSIHKSFRRKPWVKIQTAFWRASSRIGEKKHGKTERFSETGTDSSYQQCKIKRTIFQLTGAR